ncbi:MAG: hypothetical protein AMXMBFR59_27120 [Rhodanobacteraceae bacterium]
MRHVDGHAAIREIDQFSAWLQPQPIQYGACFFLGFRAKLGCIKQCIQIIWPSYARTNAQCRSRPIKPNEPIKTYFWG